MSLSTPALILASASPRRRDLLAHLGLPFRVVPSAVAEDAATSRDPTALAGCLARAKAQAVAQQWPRAVVLAADTVVVYRGRALGKPRDAAAAAAMLRRLQGRWHRVITAVAVVDAGGRPTLAHAVTRVRLRPNSEDEIAAYVASGGPMDKAGAYAIQDEAFHPVAAYDGCYCNVVGLPLWTAAALLRQVGLIGAVREPPLLQEMPSVCRRCPLVPPEV